MAASAAIASLGAGTGASSAPVLGHGGPGGDADGDAVVRRRGHLEDVHGEHRGGHGRGLLTPYAGLTLGDSGARTMRTGTRWQLSPDTVVSVEATRQSSDASETANQLTLRAAVRF